MLSHSWLVVFFWLVLFSLHYKTLFVLWLLLLGGIAIVFLEFYQGVWDAWFFHNTFGTSYCSFGRYSSMFWSNMEVKWGGAGVVLTASTKGFWFLDEIRLSSFGEFFDFGFCGVNIDEWTLLWLWLKLNLWEGKIGVKRYIFPDFLDAG